MDETLHSAWVSQVRQLDTESGEDWQPDSSAVLCSMHFRPEDICNQYGVKMLKPNAIPTIFNATSSTPTSPDRQDINDDGDVTDNVENNSGMMLDCQTSDVESSSDVDDSDLMLVVANSPSASDDHCYTEKTPITSSARCIRRLRQLTMELHKSKRREKRLQNFYERALKQLMRADAKNLKHEKTIELYKSVIAQQLAHPTGTK